MWISLNIGMLGLLLSNGVVFAAPDAHSILKSTDQARGGGFKGVVWGMKITSRDGAKVDEPQTLIVKVAGDSFVAEVQEPARSKGTKLLQVERNMWIAKPGLSKPIPISPRQRMNGQASNGDIASTNYAEDYAAQMNANEIVDGEECYVFDLSAKQKRTTYDKIRYWVSVKSGVGVKAEFKSVSGKLIKTARFEYNNTVEHEGRRVVFVSKMIIHDALVDAETTMEFSAVKEKKIAASEFDLGQLQ
ncbi:MAG: outer membrane lipoprotein-sorting protein [Gallionella sp.]